MNDNRWLKWITEYKVSTGKVTDEMEMTHVCTLHGFTWMWLAPRIDVDGNVVSSIDGEEKRIDGSTIAQVLTTENNY